MQLTQPKWLEKLVIEFILIPSDSETYEWKIY